MTEQLNWNETFLYTNNNQSERKIKKTIPFTVASKRKKNVGINLTEAGIEKLILKTKITMKSWRRYKKVEWYSMLWIGWIIIIKMSIL